MGSDLYMSIPREPATDPIENDVHLVLPPETSRPGGVPKEIFVPAAAVFVAKQKLDMRALANQVGIARPTLYRKAGKREDLLGEILWAGARHMMANAIRQAGTTLHGAARIVAVSEHFMRAVRAHEPLCWFLSSEPSLALRILTSNEGPVQRQVTNAYARLMWLEQERGHIEISMDIQELAYAFVRIGESYVYADVIADRPPNIGAAVTILSRLLRVDQLQLVPDADQGLKRSDQSTANVS